MTGMVPVTLLSLLGVSNYDKTILSYETTKLKNKCIVE